MFSCNSQDVLSILEKENQGNAVSQLTNDLPLFKVKDEQQTTSEPSLVEQKLLDLSPDQLSPLDALELLYTLRKLVVGT